METMVSQLVTEERVLDALREVLDPEIGVNVVDLGLVYGVEIDDSRVQVNMTLTTPGCPLHSSLSGAVERAIRLVLPTVDAVTVNLVWDPPWTPDRITEAGRAALGWR